MPLPVIANVRFFKKISSIAFSSIFLMFLASCGGSGGGSSLPIVPSSGGGGVTGSSTYKVGGTISGLAGTGGGLVLKDSFQSLPIDGNGGFTFSSTYYGGFYYNVSVQTQPTSPAQVCAVTNGSGTVSGNVTDIQVVCSNSVTLTLTGITGTVVLQNNGGDDLTLHYPGTYTFNHNVATGSAYKVTVLSSSSPAQNCTVTNGSGIATGNVSNVLVNCNNTIGGTISGLTGTTILQNSGTDNLTLSSNGSFTFSTPVETGAPYLVSVYSQPVGQTCIPTDNISGTGYSNVSDVVVQCANGQWTWMGGSDTYGQAGTYGTKGTGNTSNIPGSRQTAISWSNKTTGELWLFGGYGHDATSGGTKGDLNDLWKYNIAANSWTWVSGSNSINQVGVYGTLGTPSTSNMPGARDSAISWLDANGDLWLFGGNVNIYTTGFTTELNDLWHYSIANNQWTWVSGTNTYNGGPSAVGVYGTMGTAASTNVPGGRYSAVSWVDSSGNFWLFGGYGYDSTTNSGLLNDLWRFNPSTKQWTWMSGSNTTYQNGVYGTKGVASSTNIPGGRYFATGWYDAANNDLWLFGGDGVDSVSTNTTDNMNDLWKYHIATGQWTWVSGSDVAGQFGTYGTMGVASANNVPNAGSKASGQIDSNGNLWLFSGDSSNDLWKYNISSGMWTWMNGSKNTSPQISYYGTLGSAGAGIPSMRSSYVSWMDANNNLWIFGGSYGDVYNDLWRYK